MSRQVWAPGQGPQVCGRGGENNKTRSRTKYRRTSAGDLPGGVRGPRRRGRHLRAGARGSGGAEAGHLGPEAQAPGGRHEEEGEEGTEDQGGSVMRTPGHPTLSTQVSQHYRNIGEEYKQGGEQFSCQQQQH